MALLRWLFRVQTVSLIDGYPTLLQHISLRAVKRTQALIRYVADRSPCKKCGTGNLGAGAAYAEAPFALVQHRLPHRELVVLPEAG